MLKDSGCFYSIKPQLGFFLALKVACLCYLLSVISVLGSSDFELVSFKNSTLWKTIELSQKKS